MDFFSRSGRVRTNLWCHECGNDFSVDLEYDLDGNHVVHCPHCNHEHCRVIKAGLVTEDRWDSRNGRTWPYTYRPMTGASGGTTTTTGRVYLTAASGSATSIMWIA